MANNMRTESIPNCKPDMRMAETHRNVAVVNNCEDLLSARDVRCKVQTLNHSLMFQKTVEQSACAYRCIGTYKAIVGRARIYLFFSSVSQIRFNTCSLIAM